MELIIKLSTVPLCFVVFLLIIVFLVILWFTIKIVQLFWIYCIKYYFLSNVKWCGAPNTWAVITGATDGIGLSYAKAMAEKGYNLFLMSRSSEKLNKVKRVIESNYKNCNEIKTLAVDFSETDIYGFIEEELNKLEEIHVLINNVGMTYKYPEFFTRIDDSKEFITEIINVNINAMTRLISIILPQMVTKKRGIIINVCSYSACFPTPLLAIYSASKIYGDYFSRALNAEYSHKGIIVQSVLPYYVSTNMIKNPKHSFMIPSSDKFVRSAIKTVGVEARTFGYFPHTIVAFFQNFLIKFLVGNDMNVKLAYRKMKRFRDGYCAKRTRYLNKCLDSVI